MPHPFLDSIFLDRLIAAALPTDKVYAYLLKNYPANVLGWVKDADWTTKTVPLGQIDMARRPGGRNMDKVKSIATQVKNGIHMDPVVLVQTGEGYEIADGYHRCLGYQHAGLRTIEAWVGSGVGEHGPWETEMHAAKKNVEPGERAEKLTSA